MWFEYCHDLNLVKLFARVKEENSLRVAIDKHKIIAQSGNSSIRFPLPLDYPIEDIVLPPVQRIIELHYLSFRLPRPVSPDEIHSLAGEQSCLFEDWSNTEGIRCRECNFSALSGLTPYLLPSATWGFEDMRVCEECGPVLAGSISYSKHSHKKGRSNPLYIGEYHMIVPREMASCENCDKDQSLPLNDHEKSQLRSVISCCVDEVSWVFKLGFRGNSLSAYTDMSQLWSSLVAVEKKKIRINDSFFVKFVTGNRDLIIVSEKGCFWATRILYSRDAEGTEAFDCTEVSGETQNSMIDDFEIFSLPQEFSMSKKWVSSVVTLTPVILEI